MGKINLFFKNWQVKTYLLDNGVGEYEEVETDANSYDKNNYYISFNMEIYNSSEVPKIMRDIHVSFNNNRRELFKIIPYDKDTEKFVAHSYRSQEVRVLNLEAKKCIIKEFSFSIENENMLSVLNTINNINFTYTNEKNKVKKQLIRKRFI